MKELSNTRITEIGSVTQAMKAQELLSRYAIPSNVIKTESSSKRGCVYAISYSASQENNVRSILQNNGIRLSRH